MSASYVWMITKDHLAQPDEPNAVGTIGPHHNLPLTQKEIRNHPKRVYFKMYDDDGNLYYEGYIVHSKGYQSCDFQPLDDFGAPNAGCTEIRLRNPQTGLMMVV